MSKNSESAAKKNDSMSVVWKNLARSSDELLTFEALTTVKRELASAADRDLTKRIELRAKRNDIVRQVATMNDCDAIWIELWAEERWDPSVWEAVADAQRCGSDRREEGSSPKSNMKSAKTTSKAQSNATMMANGEKREVASCWRWCQ